MNTLVWTLIAFLTAPFALAASRLRSPAAPMRVVVVQLGKLGDLLCTTPLFRAIKATHPEAEVHVVCRTRSAEALKGNPHVSTVHAIETLSRSTLIRRLRTLRPTAVINCMPGAFASMLGLFALAPVRINTFSFAHGMLVRFLTSLNTHNVHYQIRTWTHAHYMRLLEPLGIPPTTSVPDFFIPPDAEARMKKWREEQGLEERSYVVCNITAGNAVKEWPEEKFAALAGRIAGELGLSVVLSTADVQRAASLRARLGDPPGVIDASGLTLAESAALYKQAAAFVSADTGPLYLAYAVGVPLVVMLGPIEPEEQVPRASPTVVHVPPPAGCVPWVFISLTPREGTDQQLECARGTSVESVWAALRTVIGRGN